MPIKVISLNIWAGELLPAAIDFLKQQQADVVLLQEVTDSPDKTMAEKHRVREILRRELDYEHQEFVHAFTYKGSDGLVPQGASILSKYPLSNPGALFFIKETKPYYDEVLENAPVVPRLLQYAELSTPAGPVNVFNIHGIWDLAGDAYTPARQEMAKAILAAVKDKPNVILGGDSNASQGNPLWQEIGRELKSVLDPAPASTFNMPRKSLPGYATAAVDVLYVSPNIKVLSAEVPAVDVSDHLPIVVTLDIS
jgi:endonuclease/exonuclease/phosphatase family metal-dependent hydrolase